MTGMTLPALRANEGPALYLNKNLSDSIYLFYYHSLLYYEHDIEYFLSAFVILCERYTLKVRMLSEIGSGTSW